MPELWRSGSKRLIAEPVEVSWRWWSRLRSGLGRLRRATRSWPPAGRLRRNGPRSRARPQRQPDLADATGRWPSRVTWPARDRRGRALAGHPASGLYPGDERQAEAQDQVVARREWCLERDARLHRRLWRHRLLW